ncbi:hypothetical protein LVB77_09965 [Lysobacter sp. 5GHs7-4]|uniref:hypothetical protein n=1 Tax=Lysobacter sp. 5GHs7-4 TaxID=2904253 RepID=UPI001E2EED3C|nr:hypothetical protein [Lysobacter sp. 5GHs7-4]UHQ24968.1 hypothetical protein LVB77_09965 [Lysobacter sp. 5GHs7-4]
MIGLIVDGDGDYAAFRARYGSAVKVMKTDGPRGHEVGCGAIVVSAQKQVAMLRAFNCNPIAIVTDLESRLEGAAAFCKSAEECMTKNAALRDVLFFVSDKMLENWLLADIAYLSTKKKYLKSVKTQRSFESTHGKNELKKLFAPGSSYNEVRHSAELFPLVRGASASSFSASFARFRSTLGLD